MGHLERHAPACDNISHKCKYRSLLSEVTRKQLAGMSVGLGPVKEFTGIEFFKQFESKRPSMRDVVGSSCLPHFDEYVMIGDIHGDMLALLGVLAASGAIDEEGNWLPPPNGNTRCFIQLGDLLDRGGRGSASRDTSGNPHEEVNLMQYTYELNAAAWAQSRSRVVTVSGNHEYYALEGAKNPEAYASFNYATAATQCPAKGMDRTAFFSNMGVRAYMATARPVMVVTPTGWVCAHGDINAEHLAKFLKSAAPLVAELHAKTSARWVDAVVGATNLLWAAHVLPEAFRERLRAFLNGNESRKLETGKLSGWVKTVLTCRSLSKLEEAESSNPQPSRCKTAVQALERLLRVDWSRTGGVCLGHSVKDDVSSACSFRFLFLDVGLSEGFHGFSGGVVAFARIGHSESVRVTTVRGDAAGSSEAHFDKPVLVTSGPAEIK